MVRVRVKGYLGICMHGSYCVDPWFVQAIHGCSGQSMDCPNPAALCA